MSCRNDTALSASMPSTASQSQPDLVARSSVKPPGPPPAATLCGNPPLGGLGLPVMTGAGDVVMGAGDVVMGAGEVVMGAGDVVMGAGDVVMGAGDVVMGAGEVVTVVGVGLGDVSVGVGLADVSVGVGLADVSVGVGLGDVSVGVGLADVSVGVGLGWGGLQPRFQMAWPAPSQLYPGNEVPESGSVNGGMMSPQPEPVPSVYTEPVWPPCPLRYWFPCSSTLEVLMVLTVYGLPVDDVA